MVKRAFLFLYFYHVPRSFHVPKSFLAGRNESCVPATRFQLMRRRGAQGRTICHTLAAQNVPFVGRAYSKQYGRLSRHTPPRNFCRFSRLFISLARHNVLPPRSATRVGAPGRTFTRTKRANTIAHSLSSILHISLFT